MSKKNNKPPKEKNKKQKENRFIVQKSHLSLKPFIPKTKHQEDMVEDYYSGKNVNAIGSAGTGKTYVALQLALSDILAKECQEIILIRSAVPTRDIGFLPGSIEEKQEPYTIPYRQIISELTGCGTAWDSLVKQRQLRFITTSYIRGVTFDNAVVILDETQSMTFHEIDSVITRLGFNSRLIVCGDTKQNDLNNPKKEKSGLGKYLSISKNISEYFSTIKFDHSDIVRSDLVKYWIIEKEKVEEN